MLGSRCCDVSSEALERVVSLRVDPPLLCDLHVQLMQHLGKQSKSVTEEDCTFWIVQCFPRHTRQAQVLGQAAMPCIDEKKTPTPLLTGFCILHLQRLSGLSSMLAASGPGLCSSNFLRRHRPKVRRAPVLPVRACECCCALLRLFPSSFAFSHRLVGPGPRLSCVSYKIPHAPKVVRLQVRADRLRQRTFGPAAATVCSFFDLVPTQDSPPFFNCELTPCIA